MLILAIEPDKRQSSQLASVVKGLQAELVQRGNAADGLAALQGRVPDLVLTSSLISPRDDSSLAAHLRELGAAAAHVQTVTIPLLGSAAPKRAKGGMLAALRREKPQAPMTDGCAPDIFAEQVRQYLATAEEQKATAATRLTVAPEAVDEETPVVAETIEAVPAQQDLPEPVMEAPPAYETPDAFEPLAVAPVVMAPVEEPTPFAEPVEAAAIEEMDALSDELVADEPAGLPLSQLLQLVSDRASVAKPKVSKPVAEEIVVAEFVEMAPVVEHVAPIVEDVAPIVEDVASIVEPEPASSFDDLYVDPMAAQALDELSRQAPAHSLADGIPAEVPVPVVEMHAFQSLDSIASELAAGPAHRHDSLDDLASLFAAAPLAPARPEPEPAPVELAAQEFTAPLHGEKSLFASLFADPAPSRRADAIEVPGIDPSLFASSPATPIAAFETVAPALSEPEPVLAALPAEVFATAPEPVFEPAPESVFEPAPEPVLEAAPEPLIEVAPEPLLAEFEVPEPEPVLACAPEPEMEPVFEDGPITFEPVMFAPIAEEPVAAVAAPALDDEIALDVDAFAFTAPEPATPPAPAEPSRFSFTFVDGFGDALSDFEVPSITAMAADLGVGEHLPLDPYAARSAAPAVRNAVNEPPAAPFLDEEALSLIGDAARKVSLDAFVIEEFERGFQARRMKKASKKKAHAGATQVAAPVVAAERPAKPVKRPVQDEWGMFDPEQAGFAALEDEEGAEPRPTTGTRVRVISY